MIPEKILHQSSRNLTGQHLVLKELIQDIVYNCIYAFSETWLSQNHPVEKLVLGIDLAMAERKFVILAVDYNLNYIAMHDGSVLQSVISPCDLKPSSIDTATRMTNSSSTHINHIITDYYETGKLLDTILKTDHFATITVLKSVILKSKTKFFDKRNYSHIAFQNLIETSDWKSDQK